MAVQQSLFREIVVDNFAGGGGASTGIEMAIGRSVDIAINHDLAAIAMHKANHPDTEHYCESVWDVDPRAAVKGRMVGLCWLSPDCKHFSKAKGGKPVEKSIRGLAWVAVRWAATVRPRVIIIENVEEFRTWGPLLKDGKPDPKQKGRTFNCFVNALRRQGYNVDWRELRACDYGAPTIRKRLFLIARCDGRPIVWPKPTHGDPSSQAVKKGKLKPWRTAAEIINWSLPCPSIFDGKGKIKEQYGIAAVRPLAENTQKRIIRGVDKFTIKSGSPFIVPIAHFNGTSPVYSCDEPLRTVTAYPKGGHLALSEPVLAPFTQTNTSNAVGTSPIDPLNTARTGGGGGQILVAPSLIQYHGEQAENARGQRLTDPIMTVEAKDREGLTLAHLSKFYKTGIGQEVTDPLHTVTTSPGHLGVVTTTIVKAEPGTDLRHWPKIRALLNQYCGYSLADDEVILLWIHGVPYFIADIGLRMLVPRELYDAQGFPPDYIIEFDFQGKQYSKSAQVARCGNAVPPQFAEHLVRSNRPELCVGEIAVGQ